MSTADVMPPRYEDTFPQQPAPPQGPVYSENKYGEMQPSENIPPKTHGLQNTDDTSEKAGPTTTTVYHENQYGEMQPHAQSQQHGGTGFGADTMEKAEQYRSDEVYAENRFGEIGRADTQVLQGNEQPSACDKLIGTAEQVLGKLMHNQELHDKGVAKKSPSPQREMLSL